MSQASRQAIRVAGVSITHPQKLWWPDERITKLDVVPFYEAISPAILPWLEDRPLVAERCPGLDLGKVIFKGPKGNARVVNVQDPEMQTKLPSLKPGQVVQFIYIEAVAVSLQPHKNG